MSKRKPFPRKVWQATVDGEFYGRWFNLPKEVANGDEQLYFLNRGFEFVLHEGTIEWKKVELDGD